MMTGHEQIKLLYQLIPQIQKLDTTRTILRKEVNFTDEELGKIQELIMIVRKKSEELMKETASND